MMSEVLPARLAPTTAIELGKSTEEIDRLAARGIVGGSAI